MSEVAPINDLFSRDPFGYSMSAIDQLRNLKAQFGVGTDISQEPAEDEFKSPCLWLAHSFAISKSVQVLIRSSQSWEAMPESVRSICDSQYHAVILMLVGYSLEICLKGTIIVKQGIDFYKQNERNYYHHRLQKLSNFIDFDEKEKAILELLTYYLYWAGRYPDPGADKKHEWNEIFLKSEKYKICAQDVFDLSTKVLSCVEGFVVSADPCV